MASVAGRPEDVTALLRAAELPAGAEVLGPVPLPAPDPGRPRRPGDPPAGESWERALVRVRPGQGTALAAALKAARAARMVKREGEAVRVWIDPPDLG
jgi:primosomal protein N' (replication factor Y)